ncbi:MAG: UDP-N-acetylmuramoyl-L-alanyl-D-glutamate--2,6-diaminopimelate ligase [Bacteroidetes bacterium]|nr:MAG: UDP-N-acetylmuramoyl-L-alanyl-D-glutamate--2,6-diaminopimelate ligase [Bacteroidota bacterium]
MVNLKDILKNIKISKVVGSTDRDIASIQFDSRKVEANALFVAVNGTITNGHNYIQKAIELGASVIICKIIPKEINESTTYIQVADSGKALGIAASNFFDNPSEKLNLVGVTGTNGKTTIASLLYEVFSRLGYPCGLLSTIENKIAGIIISATHTTPDPVQLNKLMARMVAEGVSHCFIEVSSHAIHQQRIAGLTFAGGVFTNISRDHLDYHKTVDEYIKAKKQFFDGLPSGAFALTNTDDKTGMVMLQNTKARKSTYSLKGFSDFKCRIVENQFEGLQLEIDGVEIWSKLIGGFNAYNILAVYATAILLGEEKEAVLTSLSTVDPVNGRFECFRSVDNVIGVVDYAHSPDALKNVLDTLSDIRTRNETLITVVGAGGDRDKGKRPMMAKIAARQSDKVILTSDNPRSEEPDQIINDMQKGVDQVDYKKVIAISNRKEAIKTACAFAAPGDIILLAGKGHENYQEIKGVKHPFDDKKILADLLGM